MFWYIFYINRHFTFCKSNRNPFPLFACPSAFFAAPAADMEAVQKMALIGTNFAQTQRGPTN